MSCRCVSVNPPIDYEFSQSLVYPQAILIDDINEDNKNEIVVGTANGEIIIYKGKIQWLRYSKQIGCITCMAFDSINSSKRKYLIVHDAIGYVYLFTISQVYARKRYASDISSAKSSPTDWKVDIRLFYQTKLLINPNHVIVEDLRNSGVQQMIVSYADRVIRVYNWVSLNTNTSNTNNNNNNNNANTTLTNSSQANLNITNPFHETGKFVLEKTWEFPEPVYTITVVKDFMNTKDLVATQPGGRVFLCKQTGLIDTKFESNSSSSSSLTDFVHNYTQSAFSLKSHMSNSYEEIVNFFDDLSSTNSDLKRATLPTYLVANVNFNKSSQYAYLITTNGHIFFYKMCMQSNGAIRTPLWHRNIDVIVMKYYKVDINSDENDELMIATPDGQIYAINCSGDIICFDLGEPIRGFHIGLYSSEIFNSSSMSLADPSSAASDVDLHQPSAFELALDGSPNNNNNHHNNPDDTNTLNTSLCVVFISSITNRISLLQTDTILPYSKIKPSASQFRYKCENVFSNMRALNAKLAQAFEFNPHKPNISLMNDIVHSILYST